MNPYIDRVVAAAKTHLDSHLDRPGTILYSEARTLMPGPTYLMGMNPALPAKNGEARNTAPNIRSHLEALIRGDNPNHYLARWDNRKGPWPHGKAPLQRNAREVFEARGLRFEDVLATNLVFMAGLHPQGDQLAKEAEACWPVHEIMLDIVRPKVIVCFGNGLKGSPFTFLRSKLADVSEIDSSEAGHGRYQLRDFEGLLSNGRRCRVLGLPHLSYYRSGTKEPYAKWIKKFESLFIE